MPITSARSGLQSRLRQIRAALYGPDGIARLAGELGIPERTWSEIERGGGIEAVVLLRFLHITGTDPHWLLTGEE